MCSTLEPQAFLSSLEKHQKDCRLYIDKIGNILVSHIPNMGVYMVSLLYLPLDLSDRLRLFFQEYCVNQSVAIKVLQSVRESKPELATHLQVSERLMRSVLTEEINCLCLRYSAFEMTIPPSGV